MECCIFGNMHYNTHYFLHSHNSRSIHDFEVLFEAEITIAHRYHTNLQLTNLYMANTMNRVGYNFHKIMNCSDVLIYVACHYLV